VATGIDDTEEERMTTNEGRSPNSTALIQHLVRFPEDLRDIRRLQRRFRLTAMEAARALDAVDLITTTEPGLRVKPALEH
jgi:hypothetical protein